MNSSRPATRSRSQAALSIIAAVLAALACASAVQAAPSSAKEGNNNSDQRRPAQRDDLSADQQRRPSPLALFDTDKDGTISAAEIDNASAALRALDKNGDGKLAGRELRPARPDGPDGPPPGEDEGGPSGGPREGNRPRPPRPDAE